MTIRTLLFVCAILFSGSSVAAEQTDPPPAPAGQGLLQSLPDSVQNLLHYALNFEGISYNKGGTSPASGFDCSGFVRYVFDRVEGVTLPHSSNALSQVGNHIRMSELLPGDLVFFSFMHTISHVGIYLGNDQFIHASSTRTGSVMVSNLNDSYWSKHFTLARRVEAPTGQVSAASETERLKTAR
ncbi:MAG: C40 family peptidase [Gallionella sp.]|jgi:cell wall-associated NlpC family hydrolase